MSSAITASMRAVALLLACSALLLTGCSGPDYSEVNAQIDAAGVGLAMADDDVVRALGADGDKQPCIIGYQRTFAEQSLNVGVDAKTKRVKHVKTGSSQHSVLGIRPTMARDEAESLLIEQGFEPEASSRSKWVRDDLRVTLVSFSEGVVDEVMIEVRDLD